METILKFFKNKKQGDSNDLISRTLLKIAVISRHYSQGEAVKPKLGELWRCKIIKEMGSGTSKGCFIVEPLEQVHEDQILHIAPGMFYKKLVNNRLIIIPKREWLGHSCILPLQHKHILAEEHGAYTVIVVLNASDDELLSLEALSAATKKQLQNQIAEISE